MKFRFGALLLWSFAVMGLAATPATIPLPQQMQARPGVFTLCPGQPAPGAPAVALTRLLADGPSQQTAQYFAPLLFKSTGYEFVVATNSGASAVKGAILLRR
jgi:hexosaminidase